MPVAIVSCPGVDEVQALRCALLGDGLGGARIGGAGVGGHLRLDGGRRGRQRLGRARGLVAATATGRQDGEAERDGAEQENLLHRNPSPE